MTSFPISLSLVAIVLVSYCHAAEWDAYSYPNPITAYGRCGMDSSSYICDPDGVLTREERNNVNNQLRQIEMRTRQDGNSDMCTAKGVTPVIVLVRRTRGSIHDMIPALRDKWNLDNTCKKDFIIGYATESRDYHVARNDRGPLTSDELKQAFLSQKTLLKNRQYGPALEGFARQYISKFESMRGHSVGVVKTTTNPYYYDFTSRPSLYMTLTLTLLTLAFV